MNIRRHDLKEIIRDYFRIDNIYNISKLDYSEDDKNIEKPIIKNEDRFEIALPWKRGKFVLPENKMIAFNRLRSLEKKMDGDEEFAREYCRIIIT